VSESGKKSSTFILLLLMLHLPYSAEFTAIPSPRELRQIWTKQESDR
jgi:hypothetical protein